MKRNRRELLAVALAILGCGRTSLQPKDASVEHLGGSADARGAVSDTAGVADIGPSRFDSGVGDLPVAESAVRDSARDVASPDQPTPPDAPVDMPSGKPDSSVMEASVADSAVADGFADRPSPVDARDSGAADEIGRAHV